MYALVLILYGFSREGSSDVGLVLWRNLVAENEQRMSSFRSGK